MSADLADLEWFQVDERLRKKVLNGQNMTVTRYSFAPRGRFPHHVHDQEQITYVLAGRLTFRVGNEDHVLNEGSLVIIPSSLPHSAEAGSQGAEVLSVVAPARTEGRGVSYLEEN
jgi:quercetin dioxygenase-like cupin family protein